MNLTGLPQMEFQFDLDVKGNETGKNWRGHFGYKKLNYRLKLEAAKYAAMLNGDYRNLQSDIRFTNDVLAILKFGLSEFPKWWEESSFGLELYDDNVISELYKKCDEFEQNYKKELEALNSDPSATVKI